MTTFDRYLLKRYLHAFTILFVSTYGLYVVIDGFTNVDAFQENQDGTADALGWMMRYYLCQSTLFFDMISPTLSVFAVMVVFALLHKNSEFHPILAAGVPTFRLLVPVLVGTMVVNGVMLSNQELVIPAIAHELMKPRSQKDARDRPVEPLYDRKTRIHIDGTELNVADRKLDGPEFLLPPPEIAHELTTLKAREAVWVEETAEHPSGWILRDVEPPLEAISLTPAGAKFVRGTGRPGEIFVVTEISFDQLNSRTQSYRYLSSPELVRRIKNPSTGIVSLRGQMLHFHTRLVRPLLTVIAVFCVVPLILRRESRGLVANMAICAGVMSMLYGIAQLFSYLGQTSLIAPDLAAWSPAILCGAVGAWLSSVVQT